MDSLQQGSGGCLTRGAASKTTSGKIDCLAFIDIIKFLTLEVCQHGAQAGDEGLQGVLQSEVSREDNQ